MPAVVAPVLAVGGAAGDAGPLLSAAVADLARRLRSAVLVHAGPELIAHHVDDRCTPDAATVEAIVRRRPLGGLESACWGEGPWPGWVAAALPGRLALRQLQGRQAVLTVSPVPDEADASVLAAGLRGLESALRTAYGECDPAPEVALLRRLQGTPGAAEDPPLDFPVVGARVVVVSGLTDTAVALLRRAHRDREDLLSVRAASGELVTVVRDLPSRTGEDRGLRAALAVTAQARRHPERVAAGISTRISSEGDLRPAYVDAIDAATVAARRGTDVLVVDDAWADVAVERLRRAAGDCLPLDHPLRALASHDQRKGSDLHRTVAEWLAHGLDTVATANALSLHANTLRYRLRRAQEVSGLDLTDPWQRLVAQLLLAPG